MPSDHDSSSTIESDVLRGFSDAASARATLVIFGHEDTRVVDLAPGEQLLVGRAPPADLLIDDLTLSRRHAQVRFLGGVVEVVDLGSRNGIYVRGARVDRAMLRSGDDVRLGAVAMTVQVRGAEIHSLGILGYESLLERVTEETVRARTFRQQFCVLAIFAAGGESPEARHVSRWAAKLREGMRPVDAVAVYGPHSVLVLMPQCDLQQAERAAEVAQRGTPGVDLFCGIAGFPDSAKDAEALVSASYAAAREANDSLRIRLADGESVASLHDRPVVRAAASRRIFALVERVSRNDAPVLILGETGTGKEVIATAVHRGSPRADEPLRVVNCAALPTNLVESTLFGHEKGAFTGADSLRKGVFEDANGGTVFLDELGDLSPSAQAALLRVLETKRFSRVGSTREIEVDVRVVAATHRDLDRMSQVGEFRQDLLYRLNTLTLRVPPLRERLEEIEPLSQRFLAGAAARWHTSAESIGEATLELLRRYSWPGNVRELRNVVERAAVICSGNTLEPGDLPERLRRRASQELLAIQVPPAASADESLPPPISAPFKQRVRDFEVQLIMEALRSCDGNQSRAADLLQMPLRTLVHKIKVYGLRKSDRT